MSERNDTITGLTEKSVARLRDYVSDRGRWDHPLTSQDRLAIHWLLDQHEAVYRGGLDFAPCRCCGITVAGLPEGLVVCQECHAATAEEGGGE